MSTELKKDETQYYYKDVPDHKTIALIAHDNRKIDLIEWVLLHKGILESHSLVGTGTTGKLISEKSHIPVHCYHSGPLGGDQQIGAEISLGQIDLLIFFWDPLTAQPHDPDIRALLRLSVLYNVPTACNVATADFIITSPLFNSGYTKKIIDYARKKPEIKI